MTVDSRATTGCLRPIAASTDGDSLIIGDLPRLFRARILGSWIQRLRASSLPPDYLGRTLGALSLRQTSVALCTCITVDRNILSRATLAGGHIRFRASKQETSTSNLSAGP